MVKRLNLTLHLHVVQELRTRGALSPHVHKPTKYDAELSLLPPSQKISFTRIKSQFCYISCSMHWVSHHMRFGWIILGCLGSFDTNIRAYIIYDPGLLSISACHRSQCALRVCPPVPLCDPVLPFMVCCHYQSHLLWIFEWLSLLKSRQSRIGIFILAVKFMFFLTFITVRDFCARRRGPVADGVMAATRIENIKRIKVISVLER